MDTEYVVCTDSMYVCTHTGTHTCTHTYTMVYYSAINTERNAAIRDNVDGPGGSRQIPCDFYSYVESKQTKYTGKDISPAVTGGKRFGRRERGEGVA